MAAAVEFDPKKTNINEDKLADWLRDQVSGDLEEVPGIGPANKATLAREGINNTYQLIGKYLTFKDGDVKEHQDAMMGWLKSIVSSPTPLLSCAAELREPAPLRAIFNQTRLLTSFPVVTRAVAFPAFLQGVNSGRNNIVLAMAEKCDVFIQGIYVSTLYE